MTMRLFLFAYTVIATSSAFASDTAEKTGPAAKSVEAIAMEVKPSVVKVLQVGRNGLDGLGTGFVVSKDGLIATNLHVIGEARRLEVEMSDGTKHEVTEISATDAHWDLAILRVASTDLKPLTLADSDTVKQGQPVVAMGNPEGLGFSIVDGVVSEFPDIVNEVPMIRLAMPIERGNSGGPLLDRQGRVLGLLTMKSAVTDNLGFAMPVNELKRLIEKPNPVPMARWLTIGVLNPKIWQPALGARWTQHSGVIQSSTLGSGFGGRTLCLSKTLPPEGIHEIAVSVKLDDDSGAAGLAFCAQDEDHYYGFYPSNGKLRFTRFEGPDVYSWTVLSEFASEAYRPGQWNHLRVRVEPDKITAWVNAKRVLVHEDSTLRGGSAGLCRFRAPGAEYRGFRIGADLAEKPVPEALAGVIEKALSEFAAKPDTRQATLGKLLDDPAVARRVMTERRRELERQTAALKDLEKDLHRRSITRDLLTELAKPDDKIDLLRASLLLARHDNAEVDVTQYLQQFSRMVDELKSDPEIAKGTAAAVKRLNHYLFEEGGFHGSRHDYESKANSYISELLDDREGLPITLSVLYLELASRLHIKQVYGVPLPGRFMVGYKDGPEGELTLLDVFNRGKKLTVEQAAMQLTDRDELDAEYLKPASKRSIILRMLRNLMSSTMDQESAAKETLPYLDLVVAVEPESSVERLTRAQMNQRLGDKASARVDVQWLIEHFPESGPDEMRVQLDRWMQSLREE
jgi:S1-C subfamily serine protease/regulator of sirC expression with transglutaminase-like and TPR domain